MSCFGIALAVALCLSIAAPAQAAWVDGTVAVRPIASERIAQARLGSTDRAMVNAAEPHAAIAGAPKDLDGCVTSQALDALCERIAEEETRNLPSSVAARDSPLLREVFGRLRVRPSCSLQRPLPLPALAPETPSWPRYR